eukprot:TRINITY_DN5619_c0_g1_i1.p1 TRINITY_DN5619_c0_g1~~TRINITY_DN5619_c0_g1_i1.p1  ORF type:complete len:364 (+),score=155.21 TRINITY_DN5619_c0_g1_i1:56-1093(+)
MAEPGRDSPPAHEGELEDCYRPGGLFDEFLSLQPAGLSWGGVVSVLSTLVRSHKASLRRLDGLERGMAELRAVTAQQHHQQSMYGTTDFVRQVEAAVDTRIHALQDQVLQGQLRAERALDAKVEQAREDHDQLMQLLELDSGALRAALASPEEHARVELMHNLPAFKTLLDDLRDLLAPLNGGAAEPDLSGVPYPQQQQLPQPQPPQSEVSEPPAAAPAPAMRPMVGLEIIDAAPHSNDPLASSGVRVFTVRSDGPAAAAGVQPGDCILALNGYRVATRQDLKECMARCTAGEVVTVDVIRDGVPDPFQLFIVLAGASSPAARSHRQELSPGRTSKRRGPSSLGR